MGFVSSTTFYQSKDGPSPCLETHRINLNINLFEVSRQRFALLPSITQCRIAETPHMSTRRISATLTHAHARTHAHTHARMHARAQTHTKKGMVLYSAVSSPLDRSKRFTLSSPGRPVHSDTVLGFSWKHSSHAAIAQRLFTHISTTVYSQVLIYTAESTEAS